VSGCNHLPMLSEPTLTLYCAKCGAWLRQVSADQLTVVPRAEATRGIHVCEECGHEWIGDSEYCEECG